MVFNEKNSLIAAEDPKNSRYIADFYVHTNQERSFFLKVEDWDDFANYMCNTHKELLVTLAYGNEK